MSCGGNASDVPFDSMLGRVQVRGGVRAFSWQEGAICQSDLTSCQTSSAEYSSWLEEGVRVNVIPAFVCRTAIVDSHCWGARSKNEELWLTALFSSTTVMRSVGVSCIGCCKGGVDVTRSNRSWGLIWSDAQGKVGRRSTLHKKMRIRPVALHPHALPEDNMTQKAEGED